MSDTSRFGRQATSSPRPSGSAQPVYRMTLRTLGRGDGLLGLMPFGKVGPRGGQVTVVELDPPAPYLAMQMGLVQIPAATVQWRSDELARRFRREGHDWWTLVREDDFADFCAEHVPALRERGWEVDIQPGFAHHPQDPEGWHIQIQKLALPERAGSWLVTMGVELDGERLDLAPLLADLIKRDARWLDAREVALMDEHASVLLRAPGGKRIKAAVGPIKAIVSSMLELLLEPRADREGIVVSDWDVARLERLHAELNQSLHERLGGQHVWQWQCDQPMQELVNRLSPHGVPHDVCQPNGLRIELRPYQLKGLAWLQHLRQHELGGILADDMGLGKTAQALAHVLTEKQAGRLTQPALVVVPTSLVFNWQAEAQRMAPGLRVLPLQGSDRRKAFDDLPQWDLVLTTYPLVWRDVDALRAHRFHLLILDEAQTVKNPRSRSALAIRRLEAQHRLCLTGTPMENHLGELWAQFDFLMPGFLGDWAHFQRTWRDPIEKNGESLRAQLLAARTRPFVMRRRKEDVATELPPKTEIVERLRLEGLQRDLYESVRVAADEFVRRALTRQGFAGSQISILDALLKLRQVCCDPYLLKGRQLPPTMQRAKLEWLRTALPELIAEGRRILVFSQFAEMLQLISADLSHLGLNHLMLTGQTPPPQRGEIVARFQEGLSPLMLISLKAGGVGLNLTAADTVIHVDPWWNPAVERQATDRAHRIGQARAVFVYKLVIEGSIEDRILTLQEHKSALAAAVLGHDNEFATKFNEDELSGLLAPLSD
ncbi:MAG: DEAD/DEAH box helicase [Burkholderiales bacterium]|nr:DEAD/DEAH box helicase [Burkholderiales bacterium]